MKIKSYWRKEIGDWSEEKGYHNRQFSDIEEKIIEAIIEDAGDQDKPCIRFIGGPTGHEVYYIHMLLENKRLVPGCDFSICAGTINSWPQCWVKWDDVLPLIKEAKQIL